MFILLTFNSVMEGGPVGEFITGIGIWTAIGNVYDQTYHAMLKMQTSLTSLQIVVCYMNLPTNVPARACFQQHLLEKADQEWALSSEKLYGKAANAAQGDFQYAVDLVQIDCKNITFLYPESTGHMVNHRSIVCSDMQTAA